jgi:CHASE2 domain-containing sensor protein
VIALLQRVHGRWAHAVGALPAKRVVWGLAAVFCLWVLLDVLVLQVTSGMAPASFDAMVRARLLVDAPDPRVLVVDIDESSLKRMSVEFGRWPWPRDTLATVLDYLERQAPAAIVWDVVFSDADRISPGGDAAFDAAVRRSRHSHFSVVRLPGSSDAHSAISSAVLPGLWLPARPGEAAQTATVAVIPPALAAVAAAPLGFNNGYVDSDGVLRRYRALETLPDGSGIQSIALSALASIRPEAYAQALAERPAATSPTTGVSGGASAGDLIAWRKTARAYRHIPFADVFAAADGGAGAASPVDFAGRIVIIGSTAASLHDIHPTPLAADQAGVDTLATVLDNTIHQRHLRELPRWLHALLAVLLCLGLAWWVQQKKIASLAPFTLVLPAGLLLLSYATLNGLPVFVDLSLSAALALLFLALLRYWSGLRRMHWCAPPSVLTGLALLPLQSQPPWSELPLDRLIDLLERHSPNCRVLVPDVHLPLLQTLRWPELACSAAVVGSVDDLQRLQDRAAAPLQALADASAPPILLGAVADRQALAHAALHLWAARTNKEGKLP